MCVFYVFVFCRAASVPQDMVGIPKVVQIASLVLLSPTCCCMVEFGCLYRPIDVKASWGVVGYYYKGAHPKPSSFCPS